MAGQMTRQGAEEPPAPPAAAPSAPVPCVPRSSVATGPSAPCPCSPRSRTPGGLIPRVLTSPVASCPPCPHGSPALAPAVPRHSPPALPAPQLPVPCPGYPLTARSKELGWALRRRGRLAPPGAHTRLPGRACRGARQATVPSSKERSAAGLSPLAKRALRRDTESRNQTFTPTPGNASQRKTE